MNRKVHNLKKLETYRKELRNNPTKAESKLWKVLSNRQLEGKKFRRQHSIDNYIVDFYCPSERLAIEIDGGIHENTVNQTYDYERTTNLNKYGIRVLRFSNEAVIKNIELVLESIRSEINSNV